MKRWLALLVLLVACSSSKVAAQVLVRSNVASTLPMQVLNGGSVSVGRTYQFRTNPATVTGSEDTVLALMNPSASLSGNAVAGADADQCTGTGYEAACFEWTATVAHPGVTLRLWAWRPANQGDASVQVRSRLGVAGIWTSWTTLYTNVAFGGNVASHQFPTSGRAHLATRHRPGDNLYHWLFIANWYNEWEIRADTTNVANGNNWTAVVDVPDVATRGISDLQNVVGGGIAGYGTGRLEILANDWFRAGADWDGDRLGQALETSLRTCDRPTSPDPSPGFTCASRWDCASYPASAECQGALRDTDHDGLSDYLEVYEYNDPLLMISKWGADPAHMDVFVEMDSNDHELSSSSSCEPFVAETGTSRSLAGIGASALFTNLSDAFTNGPTRINPDASSGLRVHYDVGIENPDREDDRWGNFYGGNTCVSGCQWTSVRDGGCPANPFYAVRRSAFYYALANGSGSPGQATGMTYFAVGASHHLHELGHLLFSPSGHAGPEGTTAELSNEFANWRSTYPSRLNYRFQDLGGVSASVPTEWNMATFSNGTWGRNNSMYAIAESCPFGLGMNASVLGASTLYPGPELLTVTGTTPNQCWNIDWDASGGTPSGTSKIRSYGQSGNRLIRRSEWTDGVAGFSFFTPRRGLTDMATSGDVLAYAWTQRDSSGVYRVGWRAESSGDCNELPFPLSPTLQRTHPEFYTAGSYPGCYRPGTPLTLGSPSVAADAVAVEREGTSGLIFVHNTAGTLRFSRYTVGPSGSSAEVTTSAETTNSNLLSSSTLTDASTAYSRREPGLIQVPTSLETLLVYVDVTGALRQSSAGSGAATWTASAPSLTASAPILAQRSVGLTSIGEEIWMAVATTSSIELYRLAGTNTPPASGRQWTLMTTLSYQTSHRPNLVAIADLALPTLTRLAILFTGAGGLAGEYAYATSSAGTAAASWTTGWARTSFENLGLRSPSAGSAVWDSRPVAGSFADLRSTIEFGAECAVASDCSWLSPAAACDGGFCALDGAPYVRTDFAPFTRGPAPGIYADYDDWRMIEWRTCELLRTQPALPGSPVRYCGPIPRWAEPGPLPLTTIPPLNDRVVNAHLYVPAPICQPPQPCSGEL